MANLLNGVHSFFVFYAECFSQFGIGRAFYFLGGAWHQGGTLAGVPSAFMATMVKKQLLVWVAMPL